MLAMIATMSRVRRAICPRMLSATKTWMTNGDWRDDRDYGHVWFPHVDAGLGALSRPGHWDWIAPWGYTWVDDSPWGYAPFHYGRWVTVGGRWGWIAGPVAVQAVYAPALVVFIGGGRGGFGGNVGWFPLGPREVYVPPYQVSRGYMNSGQRQQYDGQYHRHHERLQHHYHQQNHDDHQRHLREPQCAEVQ